MDRPGQRRNDDSARVHPGAVVFSTHVRRRRAAYGRRDVAGVPRAGIHILWCHPASEGLRMSNHRIRVIVETDGYTDWWVANRQRRTRKELEADRRNEVG